MNKFLLNTLLILILISCSNDNESKLEVFITGAEIAGVNGMHFGPDGYLYAASVTGSDISVIDTENNKIIKRYLNSNLFVTHRKHFNHFLLFIDV